MKKSLLLLLTVLSCLAAACSPPAEIDLSRDWKVRFIDVSGVDFSSGGIPWSERDREILAGTGGEKDWSGVPSLPGALSMERKKHLCWLRREAVIPEKYRNISLSLYLGKLWDTETAYLNGVRIGASGREYPDFHSDWNTTVHHFLPNELIRYGEKNVILIRQFSDQQLNFNGRPFIGEEFSVRTYVFWMRFMAEYIVMALALMTLFVGMAMIASSLLGREEDRVNLHFGGISVLWFFITLHFWLPHFGLVSWRMQDNLFYVLVGILVAWIYYSLETMMRYRIRWARIVIGVILLLQILMALTATTYDPVTNWRFDVMGPLGLLVQILWGYIIVKGIRDGSREARILLIGYIVFVITLLHDALMMNRVIMSYAFLSNIAYPGFILSFSIIALRRVNLLNRRMKITTEEVRKKNESLENIIHSVVESTDELISIAITVQEASDTLSSQMESQSSSLEETSASLEQVSGSIGSIADHAQDQDGRVKNCEGIFAE